MNNKEFDIIIYGATGFTGKLVAQYVFQQYGAGVELKWAIAGRNIEKLASARDEIGCTDSIPLISADSSDQESLRAMVDRTKLLLTTVGPYQLYGDALLAACATSGTDYVDLCGEPAWMREMIELHEKTAQKSGARIVFSCGFDSVPFDLGVYFLQNTALIELNMPASRVKGRVRRIKGGHSGGTIASLGETQCAATRNPVVHELLCNPFSLTPGFTGPSQPTGSVPQYEEDLDSWSTPFIMADINTRNIHRSNALMNHRYGTDFVYDEMVLTGPGRKGEAMAQAMAEDNLLSNKNAPKPGEGPSEAERNAGFYDILFVGESADGRKISVSVLGDKDPGYGSTSKIIVESAVCLVQDALNVAGGIWTPAAAMGDLLMTRLTANAGLTFQQEHNDIKT